MRSAVRHRFEIRQQRLDESREIVGLQRLYGRAGIDDLQAVDGAGANRGYGPDRPALGHRLRLRRAGAIVEETCRAEAQ